MKKISEITQKKVHRVKKLSLRLTTRTFLFTRLASGETLVLLFHHEGRISLPGGGVEDGETVSESLERELREELEGVSFVPEGMERSILLGEGKVLRKTGPKRKRRKYVLVVGLECTSLLNCYPREPQHTYVRVSGIDATIKYITHHTGTQETVKTLYISALLRLKKYLGRN